MTGSIPKALPARAGTRSERSPLALAWWCSGRFRIGLPDRAARTICRLWMWCGRVFGPRIAQDNWVRYGMRLDDSLVRSVLRRLAAKDLRIEPMQEATLAEFTAAYPRANQIATGRSLWAHGLRRAYAARAADGRPLAFVWVLTSEDNERLATLPRWGGIYSPIPADWIQLENAFSTGRALSRGQSMTDLACSACAKTDPGATGILAHVGERNRSVRRWIESLGCRPYGKIARMRLDLPLLRRFTVSVHTVAPKPQRDVEAAVPRGTLRRWIQS